MQAVVMLDKGRWTAIGELAFHEKSFDTFLRTPLVGESGEFGLEGNNYKLKKLFYKQNLRFDDKNPRDFQTFPKRRTRNPRAK